MKQAQTQDTQGSPINTTCINANERFRLQAQGLQISIANSLMCVFLTEVSLKCFPMSKLKRTHCMGIYTQTHVVCPKDHQG